MSIRVIDATEMVQAEDVSLGQNLELQINMDPPNGLYDFRAVQLIAKSESGHSSILLIDQRGCATDLTVFPQFEKILTNTTHMLRARFHAFKFTESTFVNFDVMIQFCMYQCAPINCVRTASVTRNRRNTVQFPNDSSLSMSKGIAPTVFAETVQLSTDLKVPPNDYSYKVLNTDNKIPEGIPEIDQKIRVESSEVIPQRVINTVSENAHVADTSRLNFTNSSRVLKELIDVPLQIRLNVRAPESAASESLIYGANSHIVKAGAGTLFPNILQ